MKPGQGTELHAYANENLGSNIIPQQKRRTGIPIQYFNAPIFVRSQAQKGMALSSFEAVNTASLDAKKNEFLATSSINGIEDSLERYKYLSR